MHTCAAACVHVGVGVVLVCDSVNNFSLALYLQKYHVLLRLTNTAVIDSFLCVHYYSSCNRYQPFLLYSGPFGTFAVFRR